MLIDTNFLYHNKCAVLKQHPYAAIEAKMLLLLGKYVNVPKLFEYDEKKIIMEYIPTDCILDENVSARTLAHLHSQHKEKYGLEFDTTIGPFLQPNGQKSSWVEFFRDQRLLYMGKAALEEEALPKKHYELLERVCKKLPSLIPDTPKASLLHGDVWSGNVLCHEEKLYLIDPALYYGHNEVELAFIMMFETFGKIFFDVYNETVPIEKDFFDYRYGVYQIYPYLVHVRIYGAMYLNALERLLLRFA